MILDNRGGQQMLIAHVISPILSVTVQVRKTEVPLEKKTPVQLGVQRTHHHNVKKKNNIKPDYL
jgi:hypothetical protein